MDGVRQLPPFGRRSRVPTSRRRGLECKSNLQSRTQIVPSRPMFANQSALDLEEVEMLHLVRASSGRHAGKDATVHRDLGLRGVDPGAGGPYGDPIAFSNHLVQDMAFLQGVETLVELPHAPG